MVIARDGWSRHPHSARTCAGRHQPPGLERRGGGDKRPVSARQIKKKAKNARSLFLGCGRVVRLLISTFIKAASAGCHRRDRTGRPERREETKELLCKRLIIPL